MSGVANTRPKIKRHLSFSHKKPPAIEKSRAFIRTILSGNPEGRIVFTEKRRSIVFVNDPLTIQDSEPKKIRDRIIVELKAIRDSVGSFDSEELDQIQRVFNIILNKKNNYPYFGSLIDGHGKYREEIYTLQAETLRPIFLEKIEVKLELFAYIFEKFQTVVLDQVLSLPKFLMETSSPKPRTLNPHQEILMKMAKSFLSHEEYQGEFKNYSQIGDLIEKKKEILREKPENREDVLTQEQMHLASKLNCLAKFIGPVPMLTTWAQVLDQKSKSIKRAIRKADPESLKGYQQQFEKMYQRLIVLRKIYSEGSADEVNLEALKKDVKKIFKFFSAYNAFATDPFLEDYKEHKMRSPSLTKKRVTLKRSKSKAAIT